PARRLPRRRSTRPPPIARPARPGLLGTRPHPRQGVTLAPLPIGRSRRGATRRPVLPAVSRRTARAATGPGRAARNRQRRPRQTETRTRSRRLPGVSPLGTARAVRGGSDKRTAATGRRTPPRAGTSGSATPCPGRATPLATTAAPRRRSATPRTG